MIDEPAISANELTRYFDGVVAVDRLTLDVGAGEIFGFLGHNGAGKTTTVRLLNGVLSPSAGEARVLGLSPAIDGPALRRRTGVLTETPSLDERLSASGNLTIYADLYGVPKADVASRVAELLDFFDLKDRADEKVYGYSKGMKQRLALARALLHRPEILFLDEPTAGLDPSATRRVHTLIKRLSRREGRTVLLCTHNLTEAQELCDRVGVMENGRLLALGTPGELARQLSANLSLQLETDAEGVEAAVRTITSVPGLSGQIEDDGLITVSGIEREMVPGLLNSLMEAGVRLYRVSPQEPTLADVYFALHGQGESA
jgi:ABC-2 type transport system ATP-binding protein